MRLRVLRVRRGSNVLGYAQIIEDFVENGKKNTRLVKHLGRIKSPEDMERYRKLFSLERKREEIERVDIRTLDVMPPLDYGMIYASRVISRTLYPVLSMLGKHRDIIFLGMVARLIRPSSDLSLIRFHETSYYPEIKELKKDRIYEALDSLISTKDELEMAIVRALKPDMKRVYYDLTSTYFEGREKNDLVMFGYSRDKKREKEQIVIGLVMADGIPIHHDVWKGNTVDPETLPSTMKYLREKLHVGRVIFIGDRAFGRRPSLNILDRSEYITAVYRWDQPYRTILMNQEFSEEDKIEDMGIYAREVELKWNLESMGKREMRRSRKRRAVAVWNPDRERSDIEDVNERISAVKELLASHSGKNLDEKLGKLHIYVKNGKINESRINMEKKLAGRYMIVTDTDLPLAEVVKGYKDLSILQRSFRTIKSFIDIRPVNHRRDDRIEAHVFLCVLSFLLSRLLEKAVNDEMTIAFISDQLSELKALPVKVSEGTITLRSESENAKNILDRMHILYPNRVLSSVATK
jgi:transposase